MNFQKVPFNRKSVVPLNSYKQKLSINSFKKITHFKIHHIRKFKSKIGLCKNKILKNDSVSIQNECD